MPDSPLHVDGGKETTCTVKQGTHQAVVNNMDARSGRNVNKSLIVGTSLLKHFILTPLKRTRAPFSRSVDPKITSLKWAVKQIKTKIHYKKIPYLLCLNTK